MPDTDLVFINSHGLGKAMAIPAAAGIQWTKLDIGIRRCDGRSSSMQDAIALVLKWAPD